MKRSVFALFALTLLAACGADDEPFRPTAQAGAGAGATGGGTDAELGATNGTTIEELSL